MSSTSSLSTMQRLVEQLKLEAGVERIRVFQPDSTVCFHWKLDQKSFISVELAIIHGFMFSTVSQAAAELQQYCMQNACKDALLVGVPAGSNPFREPRSCALL